MATKRKQANSNVSPIGNDNKRHFLNQLSELNQKTTEIEQDSNIPAYAQQMLKQMSALLQLAGSIIGDQVMVADAIEEDRRQHSVVFSGIKESKATTPTQKATEDKQQIIKLLDLCDVECLPVKVYRMGTTKEHGNRLIKVELPTRWHVRRLLGAKKKMADGIKVRESLNKTQLAERAHLISYCRDRYKSDPNCNCVIFGGHVMTRDEIPRFRKDPGNFICACHNK
uniref:Uncharacterized protein n=2 Tax=Meloidogyne TaxID=189290 RepID=A0A915NPZ9_9BILA